MHINWLAILSSAVIPLLTGFVWYNPKVFGNAWMAAAGLTEEKLKGANMAKIFVIAFIFSFLVSLELGFLVIHQWHLGSIVASEPNAQDPTSPAGIMVKAFMDNYGTNFRTFKHGAFHGTIAGILLVLPIIGINALFERKSFKYIFINAGYWILTIALMGGIVCGFA